MKQIRKDGSTRTGDHKGAFSTQCNSAQLSMYDLPPTYEITVEELEMFTIQRLKGTLRVLVGGGIKLQFKLDCVQIKFVEGLMATLVTLFMWAVLKDIENSRIRGLTGTEYYNHLKKAAGILGLASEEDRRRDLVSHFMLRFAYCRGKGGTTSPLFIFAFLTFLLLLSFKGDDRKWFVRQEVELFK